MARPIVSTFTENVYRRLAPVATEDERLDWPLLRYLHGLSQMFAKVEAIVRSGDGRVPYSPMLDVNVCPPFALPFLAQFAGVRLRPINIDETLEAWVAYARDAIVRRNGRNRGRPDAMIAAIQESLTGTKQVRLIERVGGDEYALTVVTKPGETPSVPLATAAMLTQKPAGIVATMLQSDTPLIDEGTRTIDATTATIDTATLADVT